MASAVPALRGKFGSTDFYLITMHGKELSERLVIPKDLEGWDDLSIEERFQREVNYSRVKKFIAPYLANDPDRFFGAFIVAIINHDDVTFEEIGDVAKGMPKIYENTARAIGFLHFQGNEVLVPLDGQHRLAALRFAISGKDEKGKNIASLKPNTDVASDLCTVIAVRWDEDGRKARRIFNKVNRYAKPTTKGENLITADDDIVAVVTREQVVNEIFRGRLVRYESNTLSVKAHEFTTLSTLYEATGMMLEDAEGRRIDRSRLPPEADCELYKELAEQFWNELTGQVDVFRFGLEDPEETGDDKRREIRKESLLGKPFGQWALVVAVLRLRKEGEDGSRMQWGEIGNRVNAVDWHPDRGIWQGIMMSGTRIVSGKTNVAFVGRFLAYYLGEPLDGEGLEALTV
ncbi:MAG: DGQHR domain-containing protein [Gemmatimonadota bacterium]|nr:DGQHR domain-containing protein [Gemmatimonadota bacterium]MDE2863509.1 DGQHR domain-containing protein [Gemmatimonadota bacterium]